MNPFANLVTSEWLEESKRVAQDIIYNISPMKPVNRFDAILEEAARLRAHRRNEVLIVSRMIKKETQARDHKLWKEVDKEFGPGQGTRSDLNGE